MPNIATTDRVGREELLEFVRPRHHVTLVTRKRDGGVQVSPVTGGVDAEGRVVVSTYPDRAKAHNLRRDPTVTVLVHSDDWDGPYVQVDGTAEVLDMPSPEAEDGLVEYFRCNRGRALRLGGVPRGDAPPGQVAHPDHADVVGPGGRRRVPAGPGAPVVSACRVRACIVPPYLLRTLVEQAPDAAEHLQRGLALDAELRQRREHTVPGAVPTARAAADGPDWVVHDARNGSELPGTPVRTAGEGPTGDAATDEAADGIAATLAMFLEVYQRDSYDGAGATVSATVHYERDYDNAFWDGTQLVFGDGDGRVFDRFTRSVDVLAHELAHAVTERTAGLVYQGQSGALNESMSDVFGACLKQRVLGQSALEGDWLVGAELFLPGIGARALRDMAAPGTAYDDPALGKDPQPGHLDDYVETTDDNGGVHLNSGIPNRAFQLAATAIGGTSGEGAGRIWYAVLTGGLDARADFATFAAATVAAAGEHADAVAQAWETVGVVPGGSTSAPGRPAPTTGASTVTVRRTGGFAGLVRDGALALDADDERAQEVRSLVQRVDLAGLGGGNPHPDGFVYSFDVDGQSAVVPEQQLTGELRRIADIVLGD